MGHKSKRLGDDSQKSGKCKNKSMNMFHWMKILNNLTPPKVIYHELNCRACSQFIKFCFLTEAV